MSKNIQISLHTPCHEDWSNMKTVAAGKHCNSCRKTVIDFTGYTDAQLHAFFSSPKCSNVCGRFYDDQLSRDITPLPKGNKMYQWLMQLSALFLLFESQQVSAKTSSTSTYTVSDTAKQNNKAAIEKEIAAVEAERSAIIDLKVERTMSLGGATSEGTAYIIDGFAYDKDGNKVKLHRKSLPRRILDWLIR